MSFPEHRAALVDSVFAELGEDAAWAGIAEPVRIRRVFEDAEGTFDRTRLVLRAESVRVRRSEVTEPEEGDVISLLDAAGVATGEQLSVSGEPKLMRNGVWEMPVTSLSGA